MGGGSHTKQDNVQKKPRSYSDSQAAVAGSGSAAGGFDREAANVCLISFKAKIKLSSTSVARGAKFKLISGADDGGLQMLSGGKRIGTYSGSRLSLLKRCIADGYTYEGVIDRLDDLAAACTVKGMGPT